MPLSPTAPDTQREARSKQQGTYSTDFALDVVTLGTSLVVVTLGTSLDVVTLGTSLAQVTVGVFMVVVAAGAGADVG